MNLITKPSNNKYKNMSGNCYLNVLNPLAHTNDSKDDPDLTLSNLLLQIRALF